MAYSPAVNLVPTGIEGLDEVLRGGLPERRLHLVQGGSGTGKTTLALQFCLAGLARGDETLYVSLSETPEEIRRIATSHGWSIGAHVDVQASSPEAEGLASAHKRLDRGVVDGGD